MDTFDNDKILCNLTFEEYVLRKRILQLKLKTETNVNSVELQEIGQKIIELRERANYLNNLKMEKTNEKVM